MILYGGRLYDTKEQDRLIDGLDERINRTLSEKRLTRKRSSPQPKSSAATSRRGNSTISSFPSDLTTRKDTDRSL